MHINWLKIDQCYNANKKKYFERTKMGTMVHGYTRITTKRRLWLFIGIWL